MARYYSTQRPVMPGGFPKKEAIEKIENFDTKTYCEEIGRGAWDYIEYREPLTKEEADAYELTLGGMKIGWVQYEQWNADGFVREGAIPVRDIQKYLKEFEFAAKKLMDETGADHVVYAWKKYNEHSELCKVCFYEGTVLDDEKFYDRTDKLPGIVYALHKRKEVKR